MESVLRTRLRWPGNFIHFYAGCHNYEGNDNNVDENTTTDDNDGDESDSDSSSYMEMPGTTMTLPPSTPQTSDPESGESGGPLSPSLPVVVEYPPGFNRHNRRRVSMFPDVETRPPSKKDRKKSRSLERRRGRAALILDVPNNDSDSSYVELPATTVSHEDDFYHGSLACEGGKRVVMREDEERGGVEIIPQGEGEEHVTVIPVELNEMVMARPEQCNEVIPEIKVECVRSERQRSRSVHFEDDIDNGHSDGDKEGTDSVIERYVKPKCAEISISVNIPTDTHVEPLPSRIMPSSQSYPQSIHGQQHHPHCQRQALCLSTDQLAPSTSTSRPEARIASKTSSVSQKRPEKVMSTMPVDCEPVWAPRREPLADQRRGGRARELSRDSDQVSGYPHLPRKQQRTDVVGTDIGASRRLGSRR